jgi:drug/metabolite transporter (DMT)-like permease
MGPVHSINNASPGVRGVFPYKEPLFLAGAWRVNSRKKRRRWNPMHRFRPHLPHGKLEVAWPIAGLNGAIAMLGLTALNQLMNIGATSAFAVSGKSETSRGFLAWQLIGSIFGLGTQLTFAGLVRASSVQLASAIGIGLAFVSAEVFSAYGLFHEPFTRLQWLGVLVVFVGLMFIIYGRP